MRFSFYMLIALGTIGQTIDSHLQGPSSSILGFKERGTTSNDNGQDGKFLPAEALASYCAGPQVHGDRVALRLMVEPQVKPQE